MGAYWTLATDVLVLKHQANSIDSADERFIELNQFHMETFHLYWNKANLRDLIAATGRVILLKIGIKSWIFLPM